MLIKITVSMDLIAKIVSTAAEQSYKSETFPLYAVMCAFFAYDRS